MALRRPETAFYSQRPTDEETLPLPPRDEKPSPAKKAKSTMSRVWNFFFGKPASTIPGTNARPAEIRASLVRLLMTKTDVRPEEANCIASEWMIGSGLELRQYGAIMYLNLFGSEYGWILYREVKLGVRNEKRLITRYPLYTVTASAASIMATSIALTARFDIEHGLTIFLAFVSILSTITFFVCAILLCWGTSESTMVERELRAVTKQAVRLPQEGEANGRNSTSW